MCSSIVHLMEWIQIISLGLIQGVTEFLPVSSSGHLILISIILGWQDQGLLMDIVAHAGSLIAVMIYFRREIRSMLQSVGAPASSHNQADKHLLASIVLATLPIMLAGVWLADLIELYLRDHTVIAISTMLFAIFLLYADRTAHCQRDEYALSYGAALLIGCAQVFALVPGASRAGVTMTAALMLGCNKAAAARFSFLLSIPTILAAIVYKSMQLSFSHSQLDWSAMIGVFFISGMVAYACIKIFVKLVDHIGLVPFVIYRLVLGGCLLLIV